jgi:glycosyltransferase involved in cell wall biosynthesis
VTRITYPLHIDTSTVQRIIRRRFSVEEDEFMFLFTFSYASVFERKNPLALLEAFRQAFRNRERARLVINCMNQKIDYSNALLLKKSCSGLPVTLIKKSLSWSDYLSLLAASDCYVSLHRAEGFGLPLAESMYLGKPVIATRYSGNLDFMTDRDSLLVDYELVELTRNIGPFEKGTVWAEPDIKHAAQLMRWVFSNRAEAKELGLRASAHVKSALDPTITAQEIQQRLAQQLRRDEIAS